MKDFKDKVLVVTGAGSGIGRCIAVEGAQRGMKIVINDIDPDGLKETEKMIKDIGAEVVCQVEDASTPENIEALFKLTMDSYGQVDVLVNNAGVVCPGPIWEVPIQDIQWITDVNLMGHIYGMHYFIPQMIKQGTPCAVINTASGAGMGVSPSSVMYHVTKTGDVVLSEGTYMALKVRGINNIQIHTLCPAFIKTTIHEADKHRNDRAKDMSDPYYESDEFKAGQIRAARGVASGIGDDAVGMVVFQALEEDKFYIYTHPEVPYGVMPRLDWALNNKKPGS